MSEEGDSKAFHFSHATGKVNGRSSLAETRSGCCAIERRSLRTLQAADIAGIRALVFHAKDNAAKKFYERFDFLPSPSDPLHLFILLQDLRKTVP